jgi:hypothetical protein
MHKSLTKFLFVSLLASASVVACKPTYNWRDYSSADAPFRVMFPDKPSTHTRTFELGGMTVKMTMTAVDINGTMFAVGSAEAPTPEKAQDALGAMKAALVRNIGAKVTKEKAAAAATNNSRTASLDIEAAGVQNGAPMKLIGHFESRDKRFYQVIVMGKEKAISPELAEQFMSSFKLQ